MDNLSDDLILEISKHLNTNRDILSLFSTCKRLKNIKETYNVGPVCAELRYNTNPYTFFNFYAKHQFSIKTFVLYGLPYSVYMVPHLHKNMYFIKSYDICLIGKISGCNQTEKLVINSKETVVLDLEHFVSLRCLIVSAPFILISNLDKCINIDTLVLDIEKGVVNTDMCKDIANMKNLRIIQTNMKCKDSIHFVSKVLEKCLITSTCVHHSISPFCKKEQLEAKYAYLNIDINYDTYN